MKLHLVLFTALAAGVMAQSPADKFVDCLKESDIGTVDRCVGIYVKERTRLIPDRGRKTWQVVALLSGINWADEGGLVVSV